MRVIAALLIVAIVCQGALAVTSKSQAKLMMEKINNKLEKSHLGRALKNMVTIATKLGYNYDDLYEAFSALKNSLLTRLDAENELFDQQSASHQAAVAQHEADIAKYSGEIVDGEAHLNDLQSSLAEYQINLANAQQALADNKHSLAQNQQDLEAVEAIYKAESDDYANVRIVIGEAVSKLQEAQSHYENAELGNFSFVQLKNTFVSFAQKIQAATQNLKSKHQLFVKPVIQSMMQVKSTTDQSSIQVAINALNDLQAYFDKALNDLTTIYVATKAQLEENIANLTQVIAILENETIPSYENQIHLLETEIQQTEEALALARANLAASEQALADENAAFAKVEERHNALVERINFEYELVGQAERIIRNAQANLEQ